MGAARELKVGRAGMMLVAEAAKLRNWICPTSYTVSEILKRSPKEIE